MSEVVRGKFISIEGVEGAGKSTATRFIAKHLTENNIPHIISREPGGTEIAEHIRSVLLAHHEETMAAETEALLMFASRVQHVQKKILPALEQGLWVISDRFFDASYAYQGSARGLGFERVKALKEWCLGDLSPDFTLLLDLPLDVSLARIQLRKQLDRIEMEEENFFRDVKEMYLHLAGLYPERFRVVHSDRPRKQVCKNISEYLQPFISEWKLANA